MPFEGEARAFTDGDLIYGLSKPRDALWASIRGKKLYIMEQFYIINGDSDHYLNNLADSKITDSFRNALKGHHKYLSAVPVGDPAEQRGDPLEPRHNEDIRRKDKGGLDWAVKSTNPERHVHFTLDDIDMRMVVGKSSPHDKVSETAKVRNITGSELRWIYRNRHREDVQARIQFWRTQTMPVMLPGSSIPVMLPGRAKTVPPWHPDYNDANNPPSLWADYKPGVKAG